MLAGFSSFFFTETKGIVTGVSKFESQGAAYTAQRGGAITYGGGKHSILNVSYNYNLNQKSFDSSFIAFWFLNSPKETYLVGQEVRVYYAAVYPKVAVLKKGPDVFLMLILVIISIIYYFIKPMVTIKRSDV